MLRHNYICAIDIGSSKIAASLAVIKKKRIENIFFETLPVKGVRRGVIVDSIALISSISKALKNLKNKSGIDIKFVYTNISGQDIVTKHSRAIIPLAERGNKVITVSDIERVNEQARILGSSLEEEIIQSIASSYTIDSKTSVISPIGLYSHRLEVDLFLVCANLSSVQSLGRAIHQAGFEIKKLLFSGLASSKITLNNEAKDGVSIFCDIGSDTTEMLIFRDGLLKDIEILNLGGDDLTLELSLILKIPLDLAEDIKRSHGIIGSLEQIGDSKEILVKKSNFYKPIKQKEVCEIVTSAAGEFCAKIKAAIEKKVSTYEVNNLIVVGRTVLLEGFIETLESTLSIPVKLGRISHPDILNTIKTNNELSGQKYLTYLTSLGMISEVLEDKAIQSSYINQLTKNPLLKAVNKFKEIYQEYF